MTAVAFALLFGSVGLTPHYAGVWPRDFGGPKKPHQQISAPAVHTITVLPNAASRTAPQGPGATTPREDSALAPVSAGSRYLSGTFTDTPEHLGLAKEMQQREDEAKAALADGRPADAVKWLTKPGKFLPKGAVVDENLLFDAYLWLGKTDEAYKLFTGVPLDKSASDETLVRASLVAALKGEVYEGQREYLVRQVAFSPGSPEPTWIPVGYSPKAVAMLSLIELGAVVSAHSDEPNLYFYSSEALKLDATCCWAAGIYAGIMTKFGHFQEAKRALLGAMDRAVGDEKVSLKYLLWRAQWFIDHPKVKNSEHFAMRDPFPNMK